jgi:hypothetical protein
MLTERSKVPSEPKKRDFFPAKNPVDARGEATPKNSCLNPLHWKIALNAILSNYLFLSFLLLHRRSFFSILLRQRKGWLQETTIEVYSLPPFSTIPATSSSGARQRNSARDILCVCTFIPRTPDRSHTIAQQGNGRGERKLKTNLHLSLPPLPFTKASSEVLPVKRITHHFNRSPCRPVELEDAATAPTKRAITLRLVSVVQ